MTAADRPSVTDNARAEAERHYPSLNADDETLTYPRSAVREHARGGFVKGYEAGWAAGRTETTAATGEDALRDQVDRAVGGVLWNATNHPDPVAVLGKDTAPLRAKVVAAVMAVLER